MFDKLEDVNIKPGDWVKQGKNKYLIIGIPKEERWQDMVVLRWSFFSGWDPKTHVTAKHFYIPKKYINMRGWCVHKMSLRCIPTFPYLKK